MCIAGLSFLLLSPARYSEYLPWPRARAPMVGWEPLLLLLLEAV